MRGTSTSGEVWKDPFTRQGMRVNEDLAQRPASRLEGKWVVGKDLCTDKGQRHRLLRTQVTHSAEFSFRERETEEWRQGWGLRRLTLLPWSSLATAGGCIRHGVEERAQLYFSGGEARMFSVVLKTYLERGKLLKGLS